MTRRDDLAREVLDRDDLADYYAHQRNQPRTFRPHTAVPFIPDPWDEVDAEMRAVDAEKEAS